MSAVPVNDDERPVSLPCWQVMRTVGALDPAELRMVIAAATGALHHRMGAIHTNRMLAKIAAELRTEGPSTLAEVAFQVAMKHQQSVIAMTASDGLPGSKVLPVAAARHEAFWLAYCQRRADGSRVHSLKAIGRFFGGRDHTTVLYGVRRHAHRLLTQPVASLAPEAPCICRASRVDAPPSDDVRSPSIPGATQ